MSKLLSFRYNSSFLRFGLMPWKFQSIMFVPMIANIRYLSGLGCLETALLVELAGGGRGAE